jgi:bile acid-coenzyme A ligase
VQPAAGEQVTEDDLVDHARGLLAPYEVPVTIAVVDTLARTPSQKVDLAATRAWFEANARGR